MINIYSKKNSIVSFSTNNIVIGKKSIYAFLVGFVLLFSLTSTAGQNISLSNPSVCGLAEALPDENCLPDFTIYQPKLFEISVLNAPGTSMGTDVYLKEVQLIVGHTWLNDLRITLTSPSGVELELTANNGGGDDNFGDPSDMSCQLFTSFDIGSCVPLNQGIAPFTASSYLPNDHFYGFNDGHNPNQDWLLSICDDTEGDVGTLEYVNLVFEPISCLPITDIIIDNIDTTTVNLSWTPSNFCGTTIVEYGLSGFTPGHTNTALDGVVQIENCPPFIINGLLPDTDYDVYIRRYCSTTGTYASNSCPTSFRTGCQPPPITDFTHFDLDINCVPQCNIPCALNGTWRNVDNDDTEWTVYSSDTPTPNTGPSLDASGLGRYIYLETSNCDDYSEAHLYSSCIFLDKQGTDSCHLSFQYHMFGSGVNELRFEVSEDDGFTWDTLWHKTGSQGFKWNKTYISLADYTDGDVLMMRFIGKKGDNPKGDIALDEITIYGSGVGSFPMFYHYVDEDLDGYGQSEDYVISCDNISPTGYVLNADDCNDLNPIINPGQTEIPCNGIDENCNASTIDDDGVLPPVIAIGDSICSGEQATLCATPVEGNNTLWYDSPTTTGTVIGFGNCFMPAIPANNTPIPQAHHFYAGQTLDFMCFSEELTEVIVIVYPQPLPSLAESPTICPDQSLNLAGLPIQDLLLTGGQVSFHSNLPTSTTNELPSSIVTPLGDSTYYYAITTPHGCVAEDSIEVTVKPGPDLTFSPSNELEICKENSQLIEVIASGGDGNYNYLWSTGSTTSQTILSANETNASIDFYSVSVTDGEGCYTIDSVQVLTTNSIDSITLAITNVTSCTGTDGSITITLLNGTPPFTASWQDSQSNMGTENSNTNTITIPNLPQGVYHIDIMDSSQQMCSFPLRNIVVQGPNAIINPPDIQDVSCEGLSDGEICIDIIGAATLIWSTGDTTNCITDVAAGDYAITITSGECTTVIDPITVGSPTALSHQIQLQHPSCFGEQDGHIAITTYGGTPPYQYHWDGGQLTPILSNVFAGDYILTITDFNNCMEVDTVTLNSPLPLGINEEQVQHISCHGANDGYIQLELTGGTPPYTYQWEDGSNIPVRYNLAPGNYTLTISDFNNCDYIEHIDIQEPDILTLGVDNIQQPDCIGNANGNISFLVEGGTPPYTIHYNGGQTSSNSFLNNLAVGHYFFYVSDSQSCTSDSIWIELEATVSLDLDIMKNTPVCVGPATGSISLSPQGTPPFSFIWEQGDTTASIQNLTTGIYPVQITDGAGCIYDTTIALLAPQVFEVELQPTSPSCYGVNDGSIDLLFTETGTPPFNFSWNDGNTNMERTHLFEGDYSLAIIDAMGCIFNSDTVSLFSPDKLYLDVEAVGEIQCYGGNDAYVEMTVKGGIPPYNINWVGTGVAHEDISNLSTGSYQVQVFDANLCGLDSTFVFHEPDSLTIAYTILQGDICTATEQDSIIAQAQGGTAPYQYTWSTGQTGHILTGVSSGSYALSIEDANGCSATIDDIKLQDRTSPIQLDSFYLSELTCVGDEEVTMTAKVSAGSGNYYYSFSPTHLLGPTTEDSASVVVPVLSPQYSVTVVDVNNGCNVESDILYANSPTAIFVQKDSSQQVSCFEGNDGYIAITVGGGTQPYNYLWENREGEFISNNQDIMNLSANSYFLTITDANDCTFTFVDSSIVEMPSSILIPTPSITDISCHGESTGSIDITPQGGTPPYTFNWSSGQLSENISLQPAGDYQVTITDFLGCTYPSTVYTITEPNTPIEIIDTVQHLLCADIADGSVAITVTGGEMPYSYTWLENGVVIPDEQMATIDQLTAGQYLVEVVDNLGCVRNTPIFINQPDTLRVSISHSPFAGSGFDGIMNALPEGGISPYMYLWNTMENTTSINYTNNNLFSVTVTDANGCEAEASEMIVNTDNIYQPIDLALWPNPVHNQLFVDIKLKQTTAIHLSITNILGQKIWDKKYTQQHLATSIDTEQWQKGVYFVQIRIDDIALLPYKIIVE